MSSSPWLQRLSPRPDAAIRLFCFHHAGGSAALYRLWPKAMPEFDICAVQLPGRANRLCEAPLNRLPAIVEALLPEVLPLIDRPYALFGHSMGSAVASYLARALMVGGAPAPEHLFVSGRQAPHLQYPDWTLRGKNDVQLLEAVTLAFGGMPSEITAEPELLSLLMPALRADLEALEAMSTARPLPMPLSITALGGADDPYTRPEHLQAWNAWTSRALVTRHLPGGHFYLEEQLDDLAALLRRTLSAGGEGAPARRAA
jgi:surfactin synthase thioesterase subunit